MSSSDTDSSSNFEDIDESTSDDDDETMPVILVVTEQWVRQIEYCSVGTTNEQAVARGTNVEKLCQATDEHFAENHSNWILKKSSDQDERLVVSFETPVFINEIHVYESLNPGHITKIEIFESQRNKWWPMWQRKALAQKQTGAQNIFKPILRRYHHQSNTIRLTFNLNSTDQIGLHAIKLLGSNIFDTHFNSKSLSQSLTKLYDQALNNVNVDIKFDFDGKLVGAHRNILICRSAYFRSLLLNNFLEQTQQKPIALTDIDYETFIEILYFIYTGAFHANISFDQARNAMIYANKINCLSATNAAMEHLCRYLTLNHKSIIEIYQLARTMSPVFDLLLDYVYDLCSEHMTEVCNQQEFKDLDKDSMIDLICQSNQKREKRQEDKANEIALLNQATANDVVGDGGGGGGGG